MLCKVFSESKLIGDLLIPAFLTKDPEIQQILCKILPAIACMSLGSFSVVLTTKENAFAHVLYGNGTVTISVVCSKCHNTERTKLSDEQYLEKVNKEQVILNADNNKRPQSCEATVLGQKNLFAKFLNFRMIANISDIGILGLIGVFSNHAVFNIAMTAELFSEENCNFVLEFVRPFVDSIFVST